MTNKGTNAQTNNPTNLSIGNILYKYKPAEHWAGWEVWRHAQPCARIILVQCDSKLLSGFRGQLDDHQPDVVFQQDGAPPHWARIVREFLDMHFSGRWVGRDAPIPWPPRSPDIMPLDFFL
jgi:hypothetical protein